MFKISKDHALDVIHAALKAYRDQPTGAVPEGGSDLTIDYLEKHHLPTLKARKEVVESTWRWLETVMDHGWALCSTAEIWTDEPQPSVAAWKELMK